jgi:hypothetical protein
VTEEAAERNIGFLGRLGAAVMGTVIERGVVALIGAFHDEHLKILMDQDFYVIETTMNAVKKRPRYERYNFTPEQIAVLESRRIGMVKRALGIMGMIRTFASRFPLYRDELTVENVRKWLKEQRPDLLAVIDAHPNKKWLENQITEIRVYFWGY